MHERPRNRLLVYGLAFLAPAVTLLVRWPLNPVLGDRVLYMAFFPAILIVAYIGGFWPGLLATVVSALAADYFLVEPLYSFEIASVHEAVGLSLLLLVGTMISGLSEAVHRSRRRLVANERRYAVTLSSIGDAVIATDSQARVTFMNPVAEALTGWPQGAAAGRPLADVFHVINEQTRQPVDDPAAKVLRTGTVVGLANHTALLARDGRETPIDNCGAPIIDVRGAIAGVVLVFRDVTQRWQSEEAEVLRRANERMELAVRGSKIAVWELAMPDGLVEKGRVTLVNALEPLGYDPAVAPTDFAGVFALSVHPEDQAWVGRAVQACLDGETREFDVEHRTLHKDGSTRWHLTRGTVLCDPKGRPIRFIGSRIDITDLKRAEEALRKSEQRFRTFADHATDAFFLFDDEIVVLDVNRQACESLGYTREELLGMTPLDFDADVTPADLEENKRKLDDGELLAFESRHRRKDGTIFPVEVRGQAFWEGGRRFIVSLARDNTERKKIEVALKESEERFRGTFDNAAVGIFHCDLHGRYLRVNQKFCDIVGYSSQELLVRTFRDITFGEDLDGSEGKFNRLVQRQVSSYQIEKRLVRKDGAVAWINAWVSLQNDTQGKEVHTIAIIEDISERKRLEVELRASEQRWRGITEALPHLIWSARPDGYVDYQSPQFSEYFGIPHDRMLGSQWLDLLHPDDRERTRLAWRAAIEQENDYDLEQRLRRFDGVYRWFKTRGVRMRGSDGNTLKWFGTCTDITDGKKAEEALRESEQRWRSLTEALPQLVWTATPDGACDYFSMQWTEFTGVPENHLLGWQWMETLHPDDREPTRQLWTNAVAGRGNYDVEYRVRRTDGEYRWFKTRGVPIRGSDGAMFKWFGTCTDITDLRRAEEALRESEERFRGTFENAGVGIAHTGPTGRLLRVNEKFCEIVGYPRAELLLKTFQDITHPDDLTNSLGALAALMRGELAVVGHEKRYVRKDGSPVWVELFTSLQRDATGQPAYAIAVVQDISERRRLDAELRRAKEAAESANRAKDEFLANVSHEIRTPMNAILGMTELALDTPLTDDQRQCLTTVKSAADNLLGIINDLLDFSKIEAGKLELDPADFSLRAALGDTLRALAVRAHRKGLELVCHLHTDVPDALVGDAGRLRQILLNLVSNAIKFTKEGEVVVRADIAGDLASDGEVSLRFAVSDTGIGISQDRQDIIFRAFEQEDTSTTRKYGGTGLGLTIAARLVALMGGTITVDSEPGRGSTFAFTARFGRQPHPPEKVSARPPVLLQNLPVLVVDDNATNRRILVEWLNGWQLKPEGVADGLAALDALWDAVTRGQPYPLVLLDGRMPDTDGLTLAAKIRKRAEMSATRIVLLTSGDRPADLVRSREVRVDAHLLKPVQQEELLETIYRVMSRTDGDEAAMSPPVRAEYRAEPGSRVAAQLRILVAEDNEFNTRHLEQLLALRGHVVQLASNGREALSLLGIKDRESGDKSPGSLSDLSSDSCPLTPDFDLMLLDLHMPELDGLQVIRAIRERERTAGGHLPVIALTARSRKEDRDRCLAAGMDDYLAKPLRSADLFAAIDRLMSAQNVTHPSEMETEDGTGLLDPVVLLAACGDDAEALRARCLDLRAYLPGRLAEVVDAMRASDAPRLREAAHKLCGVLSVFSSTAAAIATNLEDQAAVGRLEVSPRLVQQLETMVRDLLRQVDSLSIETLRQQAGDAGKL